MRGILIIFILAVASYFLYTQIQPDAQVDSNLQQGVTEKETPPTLDTPDPASDSPAPKALELNENGSGPAMESEKLKFTGEESEIAESPDSKPIVNQYRSIEALIRRERDSTHP